MTCLYNATMFCRRDGYSSFFVDLALILFFIVNLVPPTSANTFLPGRCITSLQTVLHPQSSLSPSSLSSFLCKTSVDAVLKVQGGSTVVTYKTTESSHVDPDDMLLHDEFQDFIQSEPKPILRSSNSMRKGSNANESGTVTTTSLSTTAPRSSPDLASSPLRISTSQMGNSIAINYVFQESILGQRRNRWRHKLSQKTRKHKEERALRQNHKRYAKKLKNRNNLNIGRKVLHAGFGFFFATLNQLVPKETFVPAMTLLTTSALLVECLRYRKGFGWMNDALNFVLGGTLRKHEMEGKFTGSFYYFLGVTITAACFPTSCASLGICQLALADPSASYFGRMTRNIYWSRIENGFYGIGRNKGILGFLGGALTCLPFNYHVLCLATTNSGVHYSRAGIAVVSALLGLAGSFADLCVPTPALTMPEKIGGVSMLPFHVDDNVVVPIFSGYVCTKIFEYLGWTRGLDLTKFLVC